MPIATIEGVHVSYVSDGGLDATLILTDSDGQEWEIGEPRKAYRLLDLARDMLGANYSEATLENMGFQRR